MVGYKGSIRIALIGVSGILAMFPLLSGQGCGVIPIPRDLGDTAGKTVTDSANTSPFMEFTAPTSDVSREIGDILRISWICTDPDSNAAIELIVDPDESFGNGNEQTIAPLILLNSGTTWFDLDTRALNLAKGTYRIVARINDGANPEVLTVAPGKLFLYPAGLLPGNGAPRILVTAPWNNLGVSQGDRVTISYCGSDADKGLDGMIPDIIVLLDEDNDPNNDLNLRDANAEATLADLLTGGLPRKIAGAIVVGLFKSTDCGLPLLDATGNPILDPNTGQPQLNPQDPPLNLVIDVGQIPPLASGSPYQIRAMIWDHISNPVSSYAPGSITVTGLGSGTIDLASVGRSISGTKFVGFDAGGMAGSTAVDLGDFDRDGGDDFVLVSRFGSPFGIGNIGSSHMICGIKGQKFANEVPLNSVGNTVRGTYLPITSGGRFGCVSGGDAPGIQGTDGIMSVAHVGDENNDGRPEILYGMPWMANFFDNVNDDPCQCGCPSPLGCYNDILPNPLSAGAPCARNGCNQPYMGDSDWRERVLPGEGAFDCSNDLDYQRTPLLSGGYAVLVNSTLETSDDPFIGDPATHTTTRIRGLNLVGQNTDGGGVQYTGARFRGGWYDRLRGDQTTLSNRIVPDNLFGQTVRTMPAMRNTDVSISPRFGTTLLISSPNAYGGYGAIHYMPANGMWSDMGETNSYPLYRSTGCNCPAVGRAILYPGYTTLRGKAIGDGFGYADSAGDWNLDGSRDITCGAPGATRNGLVGCGVVYILFGRPDFGAIDLATDNPPRLELLGTTANDHFGSMQTIVGDVNQDGLPDVGFSSQYADGPGGVDAGFVGIIFGGKRLTGENTMSVTQVGTVQLPGVKFYGSQTGGYAGASIANANDVNGDGVDDLLICAPNETRMINGQLRRGVAYLVFGGPHLYNGTYSLANVGTTQLPGMVFVSPYAVGSGDEAPIDMVSPAGDVNGDGFADVLIGVSKAAYVNPLEPNQRRLQAGEAYLIYGSNTGSNGLN